MRRSAGNAGAVIWRRISGSYSRAQNNNYSRSTAKITAAYQEQGGEIIASSMLNTAGYVSFGGKKKKGLMLYLSCIQSRVNKLPLCCMKQDSSTSRETFPILISPYSTLRQHNSNKQENRSCNVHTRLERPPTYGYPPAKQPAPNPPNTLTRISEVPRNLFSCSTRLPPRTHPPTASQNRQYF